MTDSFRDPEILAFLDHLPFELNVPADGRLAGKHRSPLVGRSLEFFQHREYSPGDDLRQVDWKVYGKRDKLFIRQHRQETNLTAYLLVDRTASMDFRAGAPVAKFTYACALASYTGYLLLRQGDAVGLTFLDGTAEIAHVPRGGRDRFALVAATLEQATCGTGSRLSTGLAAALAAVERRALVVLFSDLAEPEETLIPVLRTAAASGVRLVVVQVIDPVERDLSFSGERARFVDPEGVVSPVTTSLPEIRDAYARAFTDLVNRYTRELGSSGIRTVLANTDAPIRQTLAHIAGV